jgi:hypothetical protein
MDEDRLSSPDLTPLERAVLTVVMESDNQLVTELHSQVSEATAAVRTPSGVGFVTKLQVPGELRIMDSPESNALPLVFGQHPDLPSGAEFVLQVKDGRLNSIEAFCYEGMWPRDESLFTFKLGA